MGFFLIFLFFSGKKGIFAALFDKKIDMNREITETILGQIRKQRDPDSHKNDYGEALLVAGSYGMMGAALLAARACMRSGVGLLTVRVPRCGYEIMQLGLPEAKCATDIGLEHHRYMELPMQLDALAIGPGIGQHEETQQALLGLLKRGLGTPGLPDPGLILDADALNILALHPEALEWLPENTILTPHPGEAKRLLSATKLGNCFELARRFRIIVILKGHVTTIYLPNGNQWRNEAQGNAGMAVGGSGDTLTGILLGLRAQGYTAEEAAVLGVGIHALAGDLAIELGGQSEESLLPSDITAHLGQAFNRLEE